MRERPDRRPTRCFTRGAPWSVAGVAVRKGAGGPGRCSAHGQAGPHLFYFFLQALHPGRSVRVRSLGTGDPPSARTAHFPPAADNACASLVMTLAVCHQSCADVGVAGGYANVQRWTRKMDIFDKEFLLVPVNKNLHWSLAIVCHPGLALRADAACCASRGGAGAFKCRRTLQSPLPHVLLPARTFPICASTGRRSGGGGVRRCQRGESGQESCPNR